MRRIFRSNFLMAMIAIQFLVTVVAAQAPQAIPFQAVARDSKGVVIANKTVALRFSVLDGPNNSPTLDAIVYRETQTQTTNAQGLFMANIGQGTVVSGTFGYINWGTYNKYVQVEMDTTGSGGSYITIATQQLMSVPYALNSGNGVPTGTIEAFAGAVANIPTGWVLCDGSSQSTTDPKYANLYNVIGTAWGSSGAGMFNLPFMDGVFLRGATHGKVSWDFDSSSRTALQPGGNVGTGVGSIQGSQFASHAHNMPVKLVSTENIGFGLVPASGFVNRPIINGGYGFTTDYQGGSETRPVNVYVNYIIKL